MTRFSKAVVAEKIQAAVTRIQRHHCFDPNNGTAQLGENMERAVAYGELEGLRNLADALGIEVAVDLGPCFCDPRNGDYCDACGR